MLHSDLQWVGLMLADNNELFASISRRNLGQHLDSALTVKGIEVDVEQGLAQGYLALDCEVRVRFASQDSWPQSMVSQCLLLCTSLFSLSSNIPSGNNKLYKLMS